MQTLSTAIAWLAGLVLVCGSSVLRADYSDHPETQKFIDHMVEAHEFDRDALQELFSQVEKKQSILEAIARPAEKTKTWGEYRNIFVQDSRIEQGVSFWRDNHETLTRAETELGVEPQIVVAILGVETRYGKHTGGYRVMDALATLGFDYPPRASFFRKELENFLLLTRDQDFEPLTLTGSYAGAMGYGQFIPSSYRAYAVDFDDDDQVDIWQNPVDAIGSVANYFRRHGWQHGELVAVRARVTETLDSSVLTSGLRREYSIEQLQQAGLEPVTELDAEQQAMAMKLQGEEGAEFWLGLNNFEVITRYNRSQLYAMAVYQLSEAIQRQYQRQVEQAEGS